MCDARGDAGPHGQGAELSPAIGSAVRDLVTFDAGAQDRRIAVA
jgi:hypothetical protein